MNTFVNSLQTAGPLIVVVGMMLMSGLILSLLGRVKAQDEIIDWLLDREIQSFTRLLSSKLEEKGKK